MPAESCFIFACLASEKAVVRELSRGKTEKGDPKQKKRGELHEKMGKGQGENCLHCMMKLCCNATIKDKLNFH